MRLPPRALGCHKQGLFEKIRACVRFNQKRAQLWIFTTHSSNLGHLEHCTPPKRHVFLEFLVENKAYHFSKRALRAGTARSKWLKKALISAEKVSPFVKFEIILPFLCFLLDSLINKHCRT